MKSRSFSPRSRQQGVVLLFALIVLVVLLAGGVAVVRSMNTSLASAGNLAFKRDLINQGERAIDAVLVKFSGSGVLVTSSTRNSNLKSANYSATALATNDRGVPTALLSNTAFNAVGTDANDIKDDDAKVTIRYVIDRLCSTAASPGTLGAGGCVFPPSVNDVRGGSSQEMSTRLPPPPSTTYRLSMRVTGPRETQVFLQASFARPEQ